MGLNSGATTNRKRQPELIREHTLHVEVDLDLIILTGQCGLQYSMTVGDFAVLISRVKRAAFKQPTVNEITKRMLQL